VFGRPSQLCTIDRLRQIICLVALGVVLLLPGLARATCGQYVETHGSPVAPHPTAHPLPAKPAAPCHGPNCSQAPERAPLAPVTITPPIDERWAAPLSWITLPQPDGAEPFDSAPLAHGIHQTSPPDPPPRVRLS